MTKVKFSEHALEDREERIVWIATKVGFGEVIDTVISYDVERGYRRVELTSTGVAIFKPMDEEIIITMYLLSMRKLIAFYGGKNHVPIHLLNVVKRNEKKGWTS